MPRVKLDNLKEGMIVSSNVMNMDDMLLLPAGAELSARSIKLLRTWGIAELEVEACGESEEVVDPLALVAPDVLRRLDLELRQVFFKLDESVAIHQAIFKLALVRKVKSYLHL